MLASVLINEKKRERKSSGVYPDFDAHSTPTRTKKAKSRGEAERSGEVGSGVSPKTIHHNTPTRTKRKAPWRRGIPPTATQHNTPRSGIDSGFKKCK
jgi:hypothetical protein